MGDILEAPQDVAVKTERAAPTERKAPATSATNVFGALEFQELLIGLFFFGIDWHIYLALIVIIGSS